MSTDLITHEPNQGMLFVKEKSRLDDSLFSKELAPHYMNLAKQLASSELVPKSFRGKPQDLFICWAMGYQVGLTPEQSMQCIAVINGKPAMWGDDMLAICMAHKEFDDIDESPIRNKDDAIIGYVCTVMRKGKKPKINDFTLDMAKKAGLLAKGGVWTQYPERMLKLRARAFSLRDAFPDALKGIKPREEVEDYTETEYKIVEGSRTEFLKKDLLTKKDENEEIPIQSVDMHSLMENIPHKEEAAESVRPEVVGGTGKQDSQPTTSDFVSPGFTKKILQLLNEKGFTKERTSKALAYYEVSEIGQLTADTANHFIAQLNKL